MGWTRSKTMPTAEWPHFRERFESLFADRPDDPGLALRVADGPGPDHVTVSIPFFRSALVEMFSPGGWYDQPAMLPARDAVRKAAGAEPLRPASWAPQ